MTVQLIQEPDWKYHQRSELSSHDLMSYMDDKIKFFRTKVEQSLVLETSITPELQFGTDFHLAMEHRGDWSKVVAEEPSGFSDYTFKKEYLDNWSKVVEVPTEVLKDGEHRRGKEYLDWSKEQKAQGKIIAEANFDRGLYEKYIELLGQAKGKTLIKAGKINRLKEMIETMKRNPALARWIESDTAERELTILWDHPSGIKCRSRIDWLSPVKMIDWKTCQDYSVRAIQSSIVSFRYDLQAAYYQKAVEQAKGNRIPFLWVFSQKTPGFGFRVVNSESWMPPAHELIDEQMEKLANEDWSNLFTRSIETIDRPNFTKDLDEVIYVEETN